MDNQHKKIKGYRDLSQKEIDLMNRIKAHGEKTRELLAEVLEMREDTNAALHNTINDTAEGLTVDQIHESQRCAHLAAHNLQTGQMWFCLLYTSPSPRDRS